MKKFNIFLDKINKSISFLKRKKCLYKHKDKKKYLIAEGKSWRIWNNGIVEKCFDYNNWYERNSHQTWKERLEFLKLWETAEIGKRYNFSYRKNNLFIELSSVSYLPIFLGFKEECPECKKSYMVWENKIQLCKGCGYIHAFEYDDS